MHFGSRTVWIATLLSVTLGLAAWLAYLANRSLNTHRTAVTGVLEDYAALASEQFAFRTAQALDYNLMYKPFVHLQKLVRDNPMAALPSYEEILQQARLGDRQQIGRVQCFFLASPDLPVVQISALSDTVRPSLVNKDSLASDHASSRIQMQVTRIIEQIEDLKDQPTLLLVRRKGKQSNHSNAVTKADPSEWLTCIVASVSRGERPSVTIGIIFKDGVLNSFAEKIFDSPVLPASLTRGHRVDPFLRGSLQASDGAHIIALGGENWPAQGAETSFISTDTLAVRHASAIVEIELHPGIGQHLLTGGVPAPRTGFFVSLIVIVGLLMAVAIYLIRQEAELASTRADFVSGVSHEFRTPLTQIRMFAETLRLGRTRNPGETERAISIIDKEARRLTYLVESVLHFSRAERGQLTLMLEEVSMDALLNEVIESFKPLADARHVALRTEIRDPVTMRVDRSTYKQALLNVLDNAVKFGPDGQVVTVGLDRDNDQAVVWVSDEGPGIPVKERKHVLQRFVRLNTQKRSGIAGSGIGLALVHEIVVRHEGTCRIEESEAGGVRFVMQLPIVAQLKKGPA